MNKLWNNEELEQFGRSLLHPIVFYLGTWGRKGKEFCRNPL